MDIKKAPHNLTMFSYEGLYCVSPNAKKPLISETSSTYEGLFHVKSYLTYGSLLEGGIRMSGLTCLSGPSPPGP